MTSSPLLLSVAATLGLTSAAMAQDIDFFLTYHVERMVAGQLSIDSCGDIAAGLARKSGFSAGVRSFPDQLVTVSGGAESAGSYVVQCIAVDGKTVAVVQGIDYRQEKGALGALADEIFSGISAAAE